MKKISALALLVLLLVPVVGAAEPQTGDFYTQVSLGLVPGYTANYVFGHNDAVGATIETMWNQGGFITLPASATIMNITSSDVDDAAGDTGARTVYLYGLDGNYVEQNETVTLNGQTRVATTKSYLRMLDMRVVTAGSSNWNEGVIYAGVGATASGVPTTVYCLIEATKGHDMVACTTIPAGKTGLVTGYYYSSGVQKECVFMAMLRAPGSNVWFGRDHVHLYQMEHNLQFEPPYTLPEKWDIQLTAQASVPTSASAGFFMVLVDDSAVESGLVETPAMDPNAFILGFVVILVALGGVALWRRR